MAEKKGVLAAIGGILGLFIASACCLPIVAGVLAAAGGIGVIIAIAKYKLPIMLLGIGLLLTSAYYLLREDRCEKCE